MSARKTERQLDLLFILLNASRPLSREAIRMKIEEYRNQENNESFERMFERDKEELRAVGVPIETRLLDPLFEDEFRYVLKIENLGFKDANFTSQELAELTRAALIWDDTILSTSARLGLVKTSTESGQSLSITDDFRINNLVSSHHYVVIAQALVNKAGVEFDYFKPFEQSSRRKRVLPEKIYTKKSAIYLEAFDFKDSNLKTFNLSRILGDVIEFEINQQDFADAKNRRIDNLKAKKIAKIKPRTTSDLILHTVGGREVEGLIEVEYFEEESFAVFLAPISHQIADIEPTSLKNLVLEQLELALKKIS